jgi:chloride channel 3/4/5
VQDEPDAQVQFHVIQQTPGDYASSTISSLYDTPNEPDPFDFTVYMDQAPLTITNHSPIELVQQLFVKLGARYVVVVNSDGYCEWLSLANLLDPD